MTTETIEQEEVSLIRANVIKSRYQLMILTRDAIVEQVTLRTQDVKGGEWDGVPVLTIKDFGEILEAVFSPRLPPPDTQTAEVETPAYIATATHCPRCGIAQLIGVNLRAELVTDDDGSELKVKAKVKGVAHVCGQMRLDDVSDPDQVTVDETIENLRLKMLDAVGAVDDAFIENPQKGIESGPPPTLDAIALHMELVTESGRGDLEDALYHLAGLETPLVEISTDKGRSPWYGLTDAGIAYLDDAQTRDDAAHADDATDIETDELP